MHNLLKLNKPRSSRVGCGDGSNTAGRQPQELGLLRSQLWLAVDSPKCQRKNTEVSRDSKYKDASFHKR